MPATSSALRDAARTASPAGGADHGGLPAVPFRGPQLRLVVATICGKRLECRLALAACVFELCPSGHDGCESMSSVSLGGLVWFADGDALAASELLNVDMDSPVTALSRQQSGHHDCSRVVPIALSAVTLGRRDKHPAVIHSSAIRSSTSSRTSHRPSRWSVDKNRCHRMSGVVGRG